MEQESETPTEEQMSSSQKMGYRIPSPVASSSSSSSGPEGSSSNDSSSPESRSLPDRPTAPSTDLSNSYHEIFDTQMPPDRAKKKMYDDEVEREEEEEGRRLRDEALAKLEAADGATEYLTSKLVEDSLRWQRDHAHQTFSSPPASPRKTGASTEPSSLEGPTSVLDPNMVLALENDAIHLATSVDNLIENLSAVLHGISSLTVDTMETYKNGVCKTCDEVDGNIKSMYQLMAKVEEVNKSMGPAYKLGDNLKEIKKMLESFEAMVNK